MEIYPSRLCAILGVLLFIPIYLTSYLGEISNLYALISLVCLAIEVLMLMLSMQKRIFYITMTDILWLSTFFPLLYNSYAVATLELGRTIRHIVIVLFLILFKYYRSISGNIIKIIYKFSGLFIVTTLIFNSIPGLYRVLPIWFPVSGGSRAGITNHYSLNSIYISLGVGLLFSLYLSQRDIGRKSLKYFLLFILGMFALLLTTKRGQLISCSVAIIFTYYLFLSNKKRGRLIKLGFIISLVIIGILVLSVVIPNIAILINRFMDFGSHDYLAGRDKLYDLALELYKENKLFGIGWGKFKHMSYSVMGFTSDLELQLDTHNVYLNLLCETGIIGLVIFMLAFFVPLIGSIKLYTSFRKEKDMLPVEANYYLAYSVYVQIFFLVYCLSGNPLYDMQTLYIYIFAVAVYSLYNMSISKHFTFII